MQQPSNSQRMKIAQELMGVSGSCITDGTLRTYFDYYDMLTCPWHFGEQVIDIENSALKGHQHLLDCFQKLKVDPTTLKVDFLSSSFPDEQVSATEKEYATRVIIQAGFMIDCSSKDYVSNTFQKDGFSRNKWEINQSFVDFMDQTFKYTYLQDQNKRVYREAITQKKALKAWKLAKRYNINIRPTDNISDHLLYDPQERSLKVFRQIAFLRAHLRLSRDKNLDLSLDESLKL